MIVLSAPLFFAAAIRSTLPASLNFNEGWNSYHARTIAEGGRLYAAPPDYVTVNYPPLSFHLVAALGRVVGDVNLAGRWLSLVGVLWIAFCAGWTAFRAKADLLTAALCAAFCFSWLCSFARPYLGMNDPQLFAQSVMMTGVALYAGRIDSKRTLVLSCACLCLAGFMKHNLLAFPLAIGIDILRHSRRRFAWWAGSMLLMAGALALVSWSIDGPYFLEHLLSPRRTSMETVVRNTVVFAMVLAVPLTLVPYWLSFNRLPRSIHFGCVATAIAVALGVVFSGGSGVNLNIFYDAVIGLAITSGFIAADIVRRPAAGFGSAVKAAMVPLALSASALLLVPGGYVFPSSGFAARIASQNQAFLEDLDYVRSKPGPALCFDLLLCYDAGKPLLYDQFNVAERAAKGVLDSGKLVRALEQRRIGVLQIPAEADNLLAEAAAALKTHYHVERRTVFSNFYVPN